MLRGKTDTDNLQLLNSTELDQSSILSALSLVCPRSAPVVVYDERNFCERCLEDERAEIDTLFSIEGQSHSPAGAAVWMFAHCSTGSQWTSTLVSDWLTD